MATYVMMMKLTDHGAKTIKEAPSRVEAAQKNLEKMGGKLVGFYLTTGEYDYLAIGEAPNDQVLLTFLLGLGSLGTVRTTTIKAFSLEELTAAVKNLP
jgi:uncharacterized protein with GYD domain